MSTGTPRASIANPPTSFGLFPPKSTGQVNRKVSLGVIGIGRMGRRHALTALHYCPTASVSVVCGITDDELEWARKDLGAIIVGPNEQVKPVEGKTYAYREFERAIQHPGLEALIIATPTTFHAKQMIVGIEKGLHILCEKPVALNLEDCYAVKNAAAKRPDLRVMVGFSRRFDPSNCRAYDFLNRPSEDGKVGKLTTLKSSTCDMLDPTGFFIQYSLASGGIWLDCGIHDIDLSRWFFHNARALRVYATGSATVHPELNKYDDVDNSIGVIEFEGGRTAVIQLSRTMLHAHDTHLELYGTLGRINVNSIPRFDRLEISDRYGTRVEGTPSYYERFAEAFVLELQHFTQSILDPSLQPRLHLDDAIEAVRIGLALTKALRTGRLVEVSEVDREVKARL